jgi:hypothetical protein
MDMELKHNETNEIMYSTGTCPEHCWHQLPYELDEDLLVWRRDECCWCKSVRIG